MSEVKLRVWTSPKTGQVRIYADTRYVWHSDEIKDADGAYFYVGEAGETRVWFRASMDGRYGWAAHNLERYLRADEMSFADFRARVEAAKTPAGNFSAVRYFKQRAA